MKYNYAFLNIHKQLHQYIKQNRFSSQVPAGIQLEQITSILQNQESLKNLPTDLDLLENLCSDTTDILRNYEE